MEIGKDYHSKWANQWPPEQPEFKTFMNSYFEECHLLHLEIMRALATAMGLGESFFDSMVNEKAHNLRLYVAGSIG